MKVRLALALSLLSIGCDPTEGADAGRPDGSVSDGGMFDDAGPPEDGSVLDGGGDDAGPQACGSALCPIDPLRERIDYQGVWGAADDAIWVVGTHGQIRFFDGTTWTAQASGTMANLHAVHGTSATDVWAVGQYGTILHFDGAAWTDSGVGESTPFVDVVAIAPGDVWAVGGERLGSPISRHFDGATWTENGPPSSGGITAVAATADRVVMLGRDRLYELEGGAWVGGSTLFEPFDIALVGDELLILERNFGDVMVTDETGTLSEALEFFSDATVTPYRLTAPALDRVAIVGVRGQVHELDGVDTRHRARTQHTLRAAWIASDGVVWSVGDAGTIVRSEPTRMRTIDAGDQRTMLAVHARASNDVWMAGLAGNVLHFDGSAWTMIESGVDIDLRAVVEVGGSMWVGGEEGVAVRFDDTTPERHDVGVDVEIRALVADAGGSLWAAGTALHRWDGAAWAEVAAVGHPANDAWSPGPGDVWLAEEDGFMQRFVDGVEQAGMDLPGGEPATAIWGTSTSNVYIARSGPSLSRWDGSSWVGVEMPSASGIDVWHSVFGTSENAIVAVGRTAALYDGTAWTTANLAYPLLDVHGVDAERWAVGWNEVLLSGTFE